MRSTMYLVAALLVATFASAHSAPAQTAQASQITEFDVNGMKVIVKRRPGAPTVAAGLYFRGGASHIPVQNAGIETLTMNSAIEASKNFPRERLRKETSRLGTVLNAGTSLDFSAFALVSTKEAFDTSWRMFVDVAVNPTFAAEDVERVRQTLLTGLRSRTDAPEGALEAEAARLIYTGHPYASEPMGTVETVTRIKLDDIMAHHRGLLETSRMLLVVVGDVDPTNVQRMAQAAFGALPKGNFSAAPVAALTFEKPTVEIVRKPTQTDYVKGMFAAPSLREAEYNAMRVAIEILRSRIFQEVRNRRNLSYAPDAALDTDAANKAEISVTSVNPSEAVRVMLEEINKLKEFTNEEELEMMSAYFLTTYYLGQETNTAQVAELAKYELLGGGWRNSLQFIERMRQVRTADIRAVANKYMKNIRFVVVGDPARVDRRIFLQGAQN
jgi:zinc protease